MQLAVAQELSDHLPAEAFPLQQEVSHAYGCVRDEPSRDEELKALVGIPEERRGKQEKIISMCQKGVSEKKIYIFFNQFPL